MLHHISRAGLTILLCTSAKTATYFILQLMHMHLGSMVRRETMDAAAYARKCQCFQAILFS